MDGIESRSRWDNDRFCFALFDRAADALDQSDHALKLSDALLSVSILQRYGIGLL